MNRPERRAVKLPFLLGALLFLFVTGVFLPTLKNGFINLDDPVYVTNNDHVNHGVTVSGLRWAFHGTDGGVWMPLTWMSHMLDCQIYGLQPWGHHLTSVLLHAFNAVLVFVFFYRVTGATWRSWIVAALFALHPLRVESVAWVSERKDVLSAFFCLLTLLAYVRYARSKVEGRGSRAGNARDPRPSALDYSTALLCFALGLMAKPMLVTLPFVLLLLDYWPLQRVQGSRFKVQGLVIEKWPFFVLSVAASVIAVIAQQREHAIVHLARLSLSDRIENAVVSYARYLGKSFWPEPLSIFYPRPEHWPIIMVIGALVLLSLVTMVCWRGRPASWVGWLWFLGTLVPVIGLVQVGEQAMADRYTYIPHLGLWIGVVWGVVRLMPILARRRSFSTVVVAAVLAGCIWQTERQIGYWKDSATLFHHTLQFPGGNPGAGGYLTLGNALAYEGRTDDAIEQFQKALALNPRYADAHYNLANAFLQTGRLTDAIDHYRTALQLEPDHIDAHINLGIALQRSGQLDDAIVEFHRALTLRPRDANVLSHLASALVQTGQAKDAVDRYREALAIQPDFGPACNNLAWVLATCPDATVRDGRQAVELARRANLLSDGRDPNVLGTLAAAFAEAGNFPEAIASAQRAVALAQAQGKGPMAEHLQAQLESYRAGKPFRSAE